jgi:hypothetical protein
MLGQRCCEDDEGFWVEGGGDLRSNRPGGPHLGPPCPCDVGLHLADVV